MLTALNKKDHFAQLSYRRFLNKEGGKVIHLYEHEGPKSCFDTR